MIELQNITKRFQSKNVINDVSLKIKQGEIHGIVGASGAGKSTLLRMMNFLEKPSSGEVFIRDQALSTQTNKELRELRKNIGMIFQHYHLVANKTVYANVEDALKIARYPKKDIHNRVITCLQFVGLETYATSYPATLSGGQKQRVAIARALATNPQILLCDEPTSALDTQTTVELLAVLQSIQQLGITIVIVSHDLQVMKTICHRVTVLEDGKVFDTVDLQPKLIKANRKTAQQFVDELKRGETE